MASWKKVIVSGSIAELNIVSASGGFFGDGSALTGIVGTSDNNFTTTLLNKLNAIEASADVTDTTNVTAAGALMDTEVTNLAQVKAFDSSDYATSTQGTKADNALPKSGGAMTGAITTNSTFDGVDIATRDGVLTSTTTTANAALPKAGGAMTGAITTNSTFDGRDVATDGTKLDTIETNADVTDTTNVTAAGALMDTEVTNLAQVKAFDSSDYATAAQGTTADAAMPKSGGAFTGAVTTNSTIDGVDIATRDGVLTSTTTTANAALPKAGGAMTGAITTNSTFDGRDVATDGTKLDTIETNADVTDATNVNAAGAVMETDLTSTTHVYAINQGLATGDDVAFNDLTLAGDLIVNGDTTTLSTTNLSIEDKFITIASGSTSATDGGLVVSKQANGAGFGFGYDTATTRWVLDNDLAVAATGIVADAYVGTVEVSTSAPSAAPTYGGSSNGFGTMHVKTNTGDIYIYA